MVAASSIARKRTKDWSLSPRPTCSSVPNGIAQWPEIPFWARFFLWPHQVTLGFPNTKLVDLRRRFLSAMATLMCVPPCAGVVQQLLNSFIVGATAKPNVFHSSTSLECFRGSGMTYTGTPVSIGAGSCIPTRMKRGAAFPRIMSGLASLILMHTRRKKRRREWTSQRCYLRSRM